MNLTAVAGWPVGHSRSPAMHNAAFRALGMDDWLYTRLPLAPANFAETVRALPGSGYRGINVTIPHKEAALALADSASGAAAAIGAANTLTFADGGVQADNTDAQGFLDALGEPLSGRSVLVLGAGGAARAVVWAAREAGASEVLIWNRTAERARLLAIHFDVEAVERPRRADVLVNTTAVGLGGSADDLPLADAQDPELVADLVYGPSDPPVTAWARGRGARITEGLEVLLRQGALSFVRWTGQDPPLDPMRDAIRACGRPPFMRVRFRY
ncbi:MAG TPA: shikimate dehydrogenase [Thermoleophilaceae bacterium]